MRITWKGQCVYLDQHTYLEKVLKCCNMENAWSAPTPLPEGYIPIPNKEPVDPALHSCFQTIIGLLLYLMIGTQPDIAFAVTALSRYSANPSQDHLSKALYICRYLVGTKNYSLKYDGQIQGSGVIACTDSDWAANPVDRRSITGHFVKLAGGAVLWSSRAQSTVALSSTEAEYMALCDCARQVLWVRSLFAELGFKPGKLPICADNQGSIFIASNAVTEQRSKHIDIQYHFICDHVNKRISLYYIEGSENSADMLTKNSGHVKFNKFKPQMGLVTFNLSSS
jgi:hypothetical protein